MVDYCVITVGNFTLTLRLRPELFNKKPLAIIKNSFVTCI